MIVRFLIVFSLMWFPVTASENNNDLDVCRDAARIAYQALFSKTASQSVWNKQWKQVLDERIARENVQARLALQTKKQQSIKISSGVSAASLAGYDEILPEMSKNAARNAKRREKAKEKKLLGNSNSSGASAIAPQFTVEQNCAPSSLILIVSRLQQIDQTLNRKEFSAKCMQPKPMHDLCLDIAVCGDAKKKINPKLIGKINRWYSIVKQDLCKQQRNKNSFGCDDHERMLYDIRFIGNCFMVLPDDDEDQNR